MKISERPIVFNGAPRNIQDNLDRYARFPQNVVKACAYNIIPCFNTICSSGLQICKSMNYIVIVLRQQITNVRSSCYIFLQVPAFSSICLWCGHHILHGTMLGWDAKNNMLHGTSKHRKVWGNPTNAMWMPCWDGPSSPLQACAGCVVGMPRHQGINNANDWTNLHCTTPDF